MMVNRDKIAQFKTALLDNGVAFNEAGDGHPTTRFSPQATRFSPQEASSYRQALHSLPELRLTASTTVDAINQLQLTDSPRTNINADFTLLNTLGEGGMGVVYLACQQTLDRNVAVKTTHSSTHASTAKALLQEAYITGYLEHPNIIPIYLVGRTHSNQPLIIMKRVEGRSWLRVLEETHRFTPQSHSSPSSTSSQSDGLPVDLNRHIEILMQVSSAVSYAHSRGVLHRDIKPENVMLGDYGEVYLVDWGIAGTWRYDRPLLPRLTDTNKICGTPGYMAPEMAGFGNEPLDERADIFLLGATLHHIITGNPPYFRGTHMELLFQAFECKPFDYGPNIPPELAAIVHHACHRDKAHRYATAKEFRDALADYLEQSQSMLLVRSAHEQMTQLKIILNGNESENLTENQHNAARALFEKCLFGYEEALRLWPHNAPAKQGFHEALETKLRYHLATENIESARECLNKLPTPSYDLTLAVEKLSDQLSTRRSEMKRLQDMEKSLDIGISQGLRSLIAAILGIVWTITSLRFAIRYDDGLLTAASILQSGVYSTVRNFAIAVFLVILFRRSLLANRANQNLVYIFLTTLALVMVVWWSVGQFTDSAQLAMILVMLLYAFALLMVGIIVQSRVGFVALGFAISALIALIWPEWMAYANTLGTATTWGALVWFWWPKRQT